MVFGKIVTLPNRCGKRLFYIFEALAGKAVLASRKLITL
jgi:hypothetical protein